jgi:hypothetical protein
VDGLITNKSLGNSEASRRILNTQCQNFCSCKYKLFLKTSWNSLPYVNTWPFRSTSNIPVLENQLLRVNKSCNKIIEDHVEVKWTWIIIDSFIYVNCIWPPPINFKLMVIRWAKQINNCRAQASMDWWKKDKGQLPDISSTRENIWWIWNGSL